MKIDLESLERKVDQVLALNGALLAEKDALLKKVDILETENRLLAARMGQARTRLEALRDRLPEEATL